MALQPAAQQPSPPRHCVMIWCAHAALHDAALPVSVSMVQALPSVQSAGQLLSHVSPDSTTPLPHEAEQSESLMALQPAAQQPSPPRHCVIAWCEHAALHDAALPVSVSMVQALPSVQSAGQLPSQVSPASTTLLPHEAEQSESLMALQPAAQQPSPPRHCVIAWCEHAALQEAALPVSVSMVQALPSVQS